MANVPLWIKFPAVLVLLWLFLWLIPSGVWRASSIWNDKGWMLGIWKWMCRVLHIIPFLNLGFFTLFIPFATWTAADSPAPKWRRRARRFALIWPGLNVLYLPFFLLGAKKVNPLTFLLPAAWVWAGMLVATIGLALLGRPPSVAVDKRFEPDFSQERALFSRDRGSKPGLCLSLSGGGIRSAAVSIGVLQALHEMGILQRIEIVSAVSGGTYALSWLVLQPYYANTRSPQTASQITETLSEMFSKDSRFQQYLESNSLSFFRTADMWIGFLLDGLTSGQLLRATNWWLMTPEEASTSTLKDKYRTSIQHVFLTVPPKSTEAKSMPPPSSVDFKALAAFIGKVREMDDGWLPYPIFNVSVKSHIRGDYGKNQVWPNVFEITPLSAGGESVGFVGWDTSPAEGLATIRTVNVAPAVSGAAVSGYLLNAPWYIRSAIRLFNVDIGYYVPNVFHDDGGWLYLSDGGHSENLGLYALIRRGCKSIVAVDAEHEKGAKADEFVFDALTKLQTSLDHDKELGAKIFFSEECTASCFAPARPILKGCVQYRDGTNAEFTYLKLALDRHAKSEYPEELMRYANNDLVFPYHPTSDQSYTKDRFAMYRELGRVLGRKAVPQMHGECTEQKPATEQPQR